jgi:L-lactate dehydrogenase complex protein LldE
MKGFGPTRPRSLDNNGSYFARTIVPDTSCVREIYSLLKFIRKIVVREAALRVSLFITCYNDTLFPETGKAVVKVLERLGHTVEFPAGQTCCGQMHYNTGYQAEAMPLLERFVAQFKGAEAVVVPSSSCVAMMKDHYPKMAEEIGKPELTAAVDALLPRVFEFSEFLTRRLGLEDVGAYYPHRVTYHASCHGLRNLGLGDGPVRLLKAVRGIDLVELAGLEQCCGFGGTFAVKNAEVSSAMLAEKTTAVLNTKAEACTACDNSCLMHIQGALHRQRTGVKTVHLAEILAGDDGVAR